MPALPGLMSVVPFGPGLTKLLVAVAEDDRPVANAVQHPLVVIAGLGREALDIRQRRAVHVKNTVQLDLGLEGVEPAFVRAEAGVLPGEHRHHVRPVERRFTQPTLAVAADPRRVRQSTESLDRLARPR